MVRLKMGEDEVVSYLPLSHVAAQVQDMWICMRFAAVTNFAEPDALKVKIYLICKVLRCLNYFLTENSFLSRFIFIHSAYTSVELRKHN